MKRTPSCLTVRFNAELRRRMDRLIERSGRQEARDVLADALNLYEYLLNQVEGGDVNFFRQAPGGPLVPIEFFSDLPLDPSELVDEPDESEG